jgi:hypothetical protein
MPINCPEKYGMYWDTVDIVSNGTMIYELESIWKEVVIVS